MSRTTGAHVAHTAGHAVLTKAAAGAVLTAVAGLAVTGGGVYALLKANAYNATAEGVSAGTLLLTLTDSGTSKGFSTTLGSLAPSDVVNRYVEVKNTGSLDGTNVTLQLADQAATPSLLTTDATKGLQVTVTPCAVAWTFTASSGTCSSGLGTAVSVAAATLRSTPAVLDTVIAQGTSRYYQVSVALPASTEVSVNGVLPGGSVQGLTASLRWTFAMDQRAATTTSS